MQRTDPHRPSAIIPANYSYVLSYALAAVEAGWPIPPWNIEAVTALRVNGAKFAPTGGLGKCSVCGANYIYGDIWRHEPTGEHIHIGHDCADKYEMLADRSQAELDMGRHRATAAKEISRKVNAEEREAFLARHPGLSGALEANHPIVRDIAQRFAQYRALSDKQIALVFKLATEVSKPKAPAEQTVQAPISDERQTFRGIVVSAKSQDSQYGLQYKMTVRVSTPEGVWLAWGTIPSGLMDQVPTGNAGRLQNLRGAEVEITARLQAGRDAHFALMNRPVGKLIKLAPTAETGEVEAKELAERQAS